MPTWHQEELYDVHRLRSRRRTVVVLVMAGGVLLLSAALAVLVEGSW